MNKKRLKGEINSITKQIIKKYKPEKIILFGSAARGEFGLNSDLDFLIIKDDVPFNGIERRWQVRGMIKKSTPADFLVYRPEELKTSISLEDPFVKTILKEGKILYG